MSNQTSSSIIRIQLIDPHQITLWAVKQLLADDKRYQICASSSESMQAIEMALSTKPDLIIIDPDALDGDGVNIIPNLIGKTNAKVIVYTGSNSTRILDQAVVKGARGIVSKTEPIEVLVKAIDKVYSGELWLNRNATSRILLQIAQANAPKELSPQEIKLKSLTSKEEKVTRAIQTYSEKTLKQISEGLHISEHTLRNHLASIYDKLDVRNRLELYIFCTKFQKIADQNQNNHPKRRSTDV